MYQKTAPEGSMYSDDTQVMIDDLQKYLSRATTRLVMEGEAKGRADAILAVLGARGVAVTDAQVGRCLDCRDFAQLTTWLLRAATASSANEVFAESAGGDRAKSASEALWPANSSKRRSKDSPQLKVPMVIDEGSARACLALAVESVQAHGSGESASQIGRVALKACLRVSVVEFARTLDSILAALSDEAKQSLEDVMPAILGRLHSKEVTSFLAKLYAGYFNVTRWLAQGDNEENIKARAVNSTLEFSSPEVIAALRDSCLRHPAK
jgi:hypothetical protein